MSCVHHVVHQHPPSSCPRVVTALFPEPAVRLPYSECSITLASSTRPNVSRTSVYPVIEAVSAFSGVALQSTSPKAVCGIGQHGFALRFGVSEADSTFLSYVFLENAGDSRSQPFGLVGADPNRELEQTSVIVSTVAQCEH